MIQLSDVRKKYGKTEALQGIDLSIQPGDFFGLLGPNGAGKSTLMHILTGFIDADGGTITSQAEQVSCCRQGWKQCLGFVPQHLALYDQLTADENLKVFGSIYQLSSAEVAVRTTELLKAVQLEERRHEKVNTFSGGMKRRLNLVAALLHKPRILFCDEPTVGVDPHSRNAIFEYLETLNAEGMTIVYTTHYMEEVQRLCNRIAIIDYGNIVAQGTLGELLELLPYEEELIISPEVASEPMEALWEEFGQPSFQSDGTAVLKIHETFRLSTFFERVEASGLQYRHFRLKQPSLEALFLHMTGRSLRD